MMFIVVSITFEPILDGFLRFWTDSEIQDGRHSEMITQLLRHMTSSPHDAGVKRDILRHTIYLPSVAVIAEFPPPSPPTVVEDQKKPGLNRLNGIRFIDI